MYKVLVVEDDYATAKLLGLQLKHIGYEMIHYLSADDIVQHVIDHNPTLAIIDLRLPHSKLGGIDVIKILREHSFGRYLPIVAVSAGELQLIDEARQAGANHVMRKPFVIAELARVLAGLVKV